MPRQFDISALLPRVAGNQLFIRLGSGEFLPRLASVGSGIGEKTTQMQNVEEVTWTDWRRRTVIDGGS